MKLCNEVRGGLVRRRVRPLWVALVVLATAGFAGAAELAGVEGGERPVVEVTGGKIRGVASEGVASFKGVPFAAPPVGDLRWRSPQAVGAWAGVREADRFGPAPMQSPLAAVVMGGKPSEDCLYLNVWTAAKDAGERRPVMVWIYGGAFTMGATSFGVYDGTRFAKKGVVLVSIAYRLGAFGFLAHPELSAESGGRGSGCYGIQDQIAGLRWVRENIARFGGDPSRVTIFGESAGGMSVAMLAASPAAKGLFQRAISESGGSMAPVKRGADEPGGLVPSLGYAEAQGVKFLAGLGVADIKTARALSAEQVLKGKLTPCWPVADGETIVGDAYEQYERGRFNDTPVLVGTNSDDGGMFALPTSTPESFEKWVRNGLGASADRVLAAYPHATNREAARAGRDLVRESIFAWPSWAWAKLQSEKGKNKAYLYYFDYGSEPGGVMHAAELPYVFGTLGGFLRPAATPPNVAMSETIMSYWVNFATSGDPNGPGLPEWPAFEGKRMSAMIFDKTPRAGRTPNLEKIEAFDAYYARVRGEGGTRRGGDKETRRGGTE